MGLATSQQPAQHASERTRILVLDSQGGKSGRLVEALLRAGFEAVAAGAANDALYWFAIHQPDVVIIDIPLYGADRWETLRRLRAFSNVPIISLTSAADEGAEAESLRCGADHSMTRPVAERELAARVRALVRRTMFTSRAA